MKPILKAIAWEMFGTVLGAQILAFLIINALSIAAVYAILGIISDAGDAQSIFLQETLFPSMIFICSLSAALTWGCLGKCSQYYLKPTSNRFLASTFFLGGAATVAIETLITISLWNWLFVAPQHFSVLCGIVVMLGVFGLLVSTGDPTKPSPSFILKFVIATAIALAWVAVHGFAEQQRFAQSRGLDLEPLMLYFDIAISGVLFATGGLMGYYNIRKARCGKKSLWDESLTRWFFGLLEWVPTFRYRGTTESQANFWFEWSVRWRGYFPFLFLVMLGVTLFRAKDLIFGGPGSSMDLERGLDLPATLFFLNGFLLAFLGILYSLPQSGSEPSSRSTSISLWNDYAQMGAFRTALPVTDQAFSFAILKSVLAVVGTALILLLLVSCLSLVPSFMRSGFSESNNVIWKALFIFALWNWIAMANGIVLAFSKGTGAWCVMTILLFVGTSILISELHPENASWFLLLIMVVGSIVMIWKYQQATRMNLLPTKVSVSLLTIATATVISGTIFVPWTGEMQRSMLPLRIAIFGLFAVGTIYPIAALPVAIRKGRVT